MGSHIEILGPAGNVFEAAVAWPTESSVFLVTDEHLAYGEQLSFRIFGVPLMARVAFVSLEPAGAVVTFSGPPEMQERLRLACEEQMAQVSEHTSPEWREVTEIPDLEASIGPDEPTPGAFDGLEISTEARTEEGSFNPSLPNADAQEDGSDIPVLEADGATVRFRSLGQYRTHLHGNLLNGALVVAHTQLPVGSQRMLLIQLPRKPGYTVSARVVYNQPGVVGFMIDSVTLHKDKLKALSEG